MSERRNLLGTGAVLVGLSSALITGTAVATADTGDGRTRQGEGPTAAVEADSAAPAAEGPPRGCAERRQGNPAPAAAPTTRAPLGEPRPGLNDETAVPEVKNSPAPAATEARTAAAQDATPPSCR